ncbi:PIH1 domain-containing protein 1 isoform X2 [Ooceraea biroi]|uniref:PIH1 domain-containing protein 1 isoform X2 n=1 Tax=Ooceraea biroi TaxID=2015173 RepID=UPI0005B9E0C7|nr:PIH1 domain-containing protein 1 isoform X2 [Ooceraea biroi]
MASFLDVDDSLKMKNLLLDEDRSAISEQMDEFMKQLDSKSSVLVQPTPGICVKTRAIDGQKVFINICVSSKIPPPEDISDSQLFKIIEDEETTAYTIPMSIGSERMEADKSGIASATYDVMINSTYLKKCQERKHFMAFTILVILSGVADKFDKHLEMEDYVILKNRTVIGKLQQHRIENREVKKPQSYKPLIEEISTVSMDRSDSLDSKATKMVILREPAKGPAKRLIALFDMSKSVTIEDIAVLINSDRINVTDEKVSCSYDVLLPYALDVNEAEAFFDYNIGVKTCICISSYCVEIRFGNKIFLFFRCYE